MSPSILHSSPGPFNPVQLPCMCSLHERSSTLCWHEICLVVRICELCLNAAIVQPCFPCTLNLNECEASKHSESLQIFLGKIASASHFTDHHAVAGSHCAHLAAAMKHDKKIKQLLPEEMAAVLPPNDHEANEAADAASAILLLDHLQSIAPMQSQSIISMQVSKEILCLSSVCAQGISFR